MISELPLTLSQVCSRLPGARGAHRVAPSTITRWILQGCPARGGGRVKLSAIRAGGRWLVSQAALDAFFAALAANESEPPASSPSARNKASEYAAAALQAAGA